MPPRDSDRPQRKQSTRKSAAKRPSTDDKPRRFLHDGMTAELPDFSQPATPQTEDQPQGKAKSAAKKSEPQSSSPKGGGPKPGGKTARPPRPDQSRGPQRSPESTPPARSQPPVAPQRVEQPTLEVGQILRLGLQSITADGECIARIGEFMMFVSGGIPGEFVDVEITSMGPDFGRARVVRVSAKDNTRIAPKCKHFGVCGGCQWQHMTYEAQLRWKEKLLLASLEYSLPKIRFPILAMKPCAEPWGTRNKIYYQPLWQVRSESRQLVLGHNRAHSPTLEPIQECPVHHPVGDKVARLAFQVIRERGILIADAMSVKPGVKGILVRTSSTTNKSHVVIVATGEHMANASGFEQQILKINGVEGVHLNLQMDPESTYLGPRTLHLAGEPRLMEEIGDVKFQISPDSFFQTNIRAARTLYDVVYRMVSEQRCDPILDLYSGVGLFSLPLAKRGRTVLAVEENGQAVEDGRATAEFNGIQNCEFIADRVEHVLKSMPREQKFHTVILDPPREGCMEWVLRLLGRRFRPKRIVYVSCNPTALGRDLNMLLQSGYRVDEIQPVDMFPHTSHIESVTLLNRK